MTPRLASRARLKWDRREGRYWLLCPERGLALNETAAAILELCNGARSVDEIAFELARVRAGADATLVRRDVEAFLGEMRRRGLVET